jgi:hypothetical protein
MCIWHKYSDWGLVQDNKCDGQALQQRTCNVCGYAQRNTLDYVPIHTWTSWVETGTLKRHFYGVEKDSNVIINKVMTRCCHNCNILQRIFT